MVSDPYAVLQVPPDAPAAELKKAAETALAQALEHVRAQKLKLK